MFIELSTFLPGYPAPSNFNHETWVAQDNKITRAEGGRGMSQVHPLLRRSLPVGTVSATGVRNSGAG